MTPEDLKAEDEFLEAQAKTMRERFREIEPSESYRRQVNRDKAWTQKRVEMIWGDLDADKIADS